MKTILSYHNDPGLPEWMAYLKEHFAEDFLEAIPVGVDMEPVRHKLAICVMSRPSSDWRTTLSLTPLHVATRLS